MGAQTRRRVEPEYGEMGERLRAERRRHGLSLRELAARVGISASLISQVETGRAAPSVSTLYALASELGVSLDDLLFTARGAAARADREPPRLIPADPASTAAATPSPSSPWQPAGSRKHIRLASGVVWERLTTISEPGVEFLFVTYGAGSASSPDDAYQRHAGHEWGYVISGTLNVTVAFEEYLLGPGDAISIDSMVPHRLVNHGPEAVHGIWFVLGRQAPYEHPASPPGPARGDVARPAARQRGLSGLRQDGLGERLELVQVGVGGVEEELVRAGRLVGLDGGPQRVRIGRHPGCHAAAPVAVVVGQVRRPRCPARRRRGRSRREPTAAGVPVRPAAFQAARVASFEVRVSAGLEPPAVQPTPYLAARS